MGPLIHFSKTFSKIIAYLATIGLIKNSKRFNYFGNFPDT